MTQRFTDVGLPAQLAQTWFAQVLRDGFALAAAGGSATFSAIADGVLRSLFPQHAPDRDPGEAVQHVGRLVAVHPWGFDGAVRAGLQTAWVDRSGGTRYPPYLTTTALTTADLTVSGVDDLARKVTGPAKAT